MRLAVILIASYVVVGLLTFFVQHLFEFGVYQHGEVVCGSGECSLTCTPEEVTGGDAAAIARVRVLVPSVHLAAVIMRELYHAVVGSIIYPSEYETSV